MDANRSGDTMTTKEPLSTTLHKVGVQLHDVQEELQALKLVAAQTEWATWARAEIARLQRELEASQKQAADMTAARDYWLAESAKWAAEEERLQQLLAEAWGPTS